MYLSIQRRFGLQARFIGLILILLTTIFAVIAFVLIDINTNSLRSDLQDRSKAFATLATTPIGNAYQTYQDSGTYLIGKQISSFQALDPTIANISIVDLSGNVVFSMDGSPESVSARDAGAFDPVYKYQAGTVSRIIYPYIGASGRHSNAIVYDISSAEIDMEVHQLEQSILLYSIIGLVASAVVTYVFINRMFLRPIKQLRDQAMVIAAGHYDGQIPHDRHDEIGDLAGSVNQMAESLKADIQKLKEVDQIKTEFMMIASHNLRTPLTVINGYLEMAKTQALSEELRMMLQSIEANSQRLGIFAEDLLMISGIESGQKIFTSERMSVNDLLSSTIKEFTVLAEEKKVALRSHVETEHAEIFGSKPHLRGAVWNLLDNALKFTKEGGTIDLKLTRIDNNIQISVTDTGAGIPPEEISKLFTKFHRGTSTLTYNYEGTGIGLYVTKLIVTEHHGTIAVTSEPGKGSTFTIILPVAEETEKEPVPHSPGHSDHSAEKPADPVQPAVN